MVIGMAMRKYLQEAQVPEYLFSEYKNVLNRPAHYYEQRLV